VTTTRGRRSRPLGLSARLALASLGTAIAIGVVCAVGLSSLENTAAVTRVAVTQQLALIDDAAAMSAFQYQKGFVAEYLLSGNREWLAELETSRPAFESWLAGAHAKIANPASAKLLDDIQREYAAYDRARKTAITLYDARKV
jgi:CHASE3 domain sensor protein